MSIQLFFPPVTYVKALRLTDLSASHRHVLTLESLCRHAGVPCRGTGAWIQRKIILTSTSDKAILGITAEPGDWGSVQITLPRLRKKNDISKNEARMALSALAYGLHDLVAKQSIVETPWETSLGISRGISWAKLKAPRGRPRNPQALSNKERQRRFRERKKKKAGYGRG